MAQIKAAVAPGQYGKFITALLGAVVSYLTAYGTVWNLQGALVMAAVPLAVLGVPNSAPQPPPVAPEHAGPEHAAP